MWLKNNSVQDYKFLLTIINEHTVYTIQSLAEYKQLQQKWWQFNFKNCKSSLQQPLIYTHKNKVLRK